VSYNAQLKVGDIVVHKEQLELGEGRIKKFYHSHGTVFVKFKNLKSYTYYSPWNLEKVS